jgi:hypothetical protein
MTLFITRNPWTLKADLWADCEQALSIPPARQAMAPMTAPIVATGRGRVLAGTQDISCNVLLAPKGRALISGVSQLLISRCTIASELNRFQRSRPSTGHPVTAPRDGFTGRRCTPAVSIGHAGIGSDRSASIGAIAVVKPSGRSFLFYSAGSATFHSVFVLFKLIT